MDKEEVKKITHPFCFDEDIAFAEKGCPQPDNSFCKSCETEAQQICQLKSRGKRHPQCNHKEMACSNMEKQHGGIFGDYYGVCLLKNPFDCPYEPKPDEVDMNQVVGHGGEVDDSDMTSEETAASILAIIKPDEGRLLTDEEETEYRKSIGRRNYTWCVQCPDWYRKILKEAQDAKTVSIYEQKIEEIFKEIGSYLGFDIVELEDLPVWWQALKSKYLLGVRDESKTMP